MSLSKEQTHFKHVLFISCSKSFLCNKSNNTQEYKILFNKFIKDILRNLTFENAYESFIAISLDPVCQQLDRKIPSEFFQNSQLIIKSWTDNNILSSSLNHGNIEYLGNETLSNSAKFIKLQYPLESTILKILDIGSGNGKSAERLSCYLGDNYLITCTDPISRSKSKVKRLNAIQAIGKLNSKIDVVLIMSPTPSGFQENIPFMPDVVGAGFDALLIDYMIKNNIKKDIIIIGECGAGDSIQGMHDFLTNNPKLKTKYYVVNNVIKTQKIPINQFQIIDFTTRVMKLIYFVKIL